MALNLFYDLPLDLQEVIWNKKEQLEEEDINNGMIVVKETLIKNKIKETCLPLERYSERKYRQGRLEVNDNIRSFYNEIRPIISNEKFNSISEKVKELIEKHYPSFDFGGCDLFLEQRNKYCEYFLVSLVSNG